jgi:predicted small secreted protein
MSKKSLAVIGGIVAVLALTAGCADNGMFGGGTDVAYGEEVTLEQNSGSSKFTVKVDEPRGFDYDASEGMIALAVDIEASTEKGAPSTNRILGPFSLISPSGESVANHVADTPEGIYFGTSMPREGESKSGTLVFLVEEEGDYTVQYKSPLKSEDVSATWSKSE